MSAYTDKRSLFNNLKPGEFPVAYEHPNDHGSLTFSKFSSFEDFEKVRQEYPDVIYYEILDCSNNYNFDPLIRPFFSFQMQENWSQTHVKYATEELIKQRIKDSYPDFNENSMEFIWDFYSNTACVRVKNALCKPGQEFDILRQIVGLLPEQDENLVRIPNTQHQLIDLLIKPQGYTNLDNELRLPVKINPDNYETIDFVNRWPTQGYLKLANGKTVQCFQYLKTHEYNLFNQIPNYRDKLIFCWTPSGYKKGVTIENNEVRDNIKDSKCFFALNSYEELTEVMLNLGDWKLWNFFNYSLGDRPLTLKFDLDISATLINHDINQANYVRNLIIQAIKQTFEKYGEPFDINKNILIFESRRYLKIVLENCFISRWLNIIIFILFNNYTSLKEKSWNQQIHMQTQIK